MPHPKHPLHERALSLRDLPDRGEIVEYNAVTRTTFFEGLVAGKPFSKADLGNKLFLPVQRFGAKGKEELALVDLGLVPYFDTTDPTQHRWIWRTITILREDLPQIQREKEQLCTRALELEAAYGQYNRRVPHPTYTLS